MQVNPLNLEPNVANPSDPVGGFAGIARNFTGIATKLAMAGYRTHFAGKWDAGMVRLTTALPRPSWRADRQARNATMHTVVVGAAQQLN